MSDHWHAISVAARFEKYDGVFAKFYIEGNINPKATDLLDYSRIFTGEEDNDRFIMKGLWPTPDAVMQLDGYKHYFFGKYTYVQTSDTTYQWTPLSVLFPNLSMNWQDGVDEIVEDHKNKRWIFIKGSHYITAPFSNVHGITAPLPLDDLIKGLPTLPGDFSIEAAYIIGDDFYILKNDKAFVAKRIKGKQFDVRKSVTVRDLFATYPFGWGAGSPDAAYYDGQSEELLLFKNREHIKIKDSAIEKGFPKRLNLKWPNNNIIK